LAPHATLKRLNVANEIVVCLPLVHVAGGLCKKHIRGRQWHTWEVR
jgi:uncharacterized membrane protein